MNPLMVKALLNFISRNLWNRSSLKFACGKFAAWLFCLIGIWGILKGMHALPFCTAAQCAVLFATGALFLQSVKLLFAFWRGLGIQWLGFWIIYLIYSYGVIQVAAPYSDINYIQNFTGAVLALMWNQSNRQIEKISASSSRIAGWGIYGLWIATGAAVQTWLVYPKLFALADNEQVICSFVINLLILIFA